MKKSRSFVSPLLTIFLSIVLIGCGDFSNPVDVENLFSSTSVSGRSSKGPISNATIVVYALNGDGSMSDMIGTTTTDSEGRYSINPGSYSGAVLVSLTGGQYLDEASDLTVQNVITLHAVIPEASGSANAMVTPLTELAYRNAGVLTAENIGSANAIISNLFGVDILATEPVDPSDSTEAASATQAQKDYGLILAAISELSQSTGVTVSETSENVSSLLDNLEADVADGELDAMGTQLLSGLTSFLGSGNNNTGIFDLDGTGLDEAIITGGISYSGVWYETDGDTGEFSISFTQTDTSFDGTFFVVSNTGEGGTSIYSLSGTRAENSYRGTDSRGREFIFEFRQHPLGSSDNFLVGSYFDPSGGERGSMRSTNNNGYNSINGFVDLEGKTDHSGVVVEFAQNPSFSGTTDDHGYYCLYGFPDGSYSVEASRSGYTAETSGPWDFSGSTTHHQGANLTLREIVLEPPTVTTLDSSSIGDNGATLSGTVNPNDLETDAWFEWGTSSSSLVSSTAVQSVGSGKTTKSYTYDLAGLSSGTTYYYRIAASNGGGKKKGIIKKLTTTGVPPSVSTSSATSVTSNSATLNGSVNPNGSPSEAWFEYGTSSSSLVSSTPKESVGSGTSEQPYSYDLGGLNPNTTYYFRIAISNSSGSDYGTVLSFTTTSIPPGVSTSSTTFISTSGATLNGSVNPNGSNTQAWFEWGTSSSSLANSTPSQSAGSGTSSQPYSYNLTGLSSSTTYYYRIAASNSAGTVRGAVMNFTTGTIPVPPAASTGSATSISTSSATLNGNVDPNGFSTQAWFEWGTSSSSLSNSTPAQSVGSGTSSQPYSYNLTGLSSSTTYYYRIAASNSAGTVRGTVQSFTTNTPPPPPSTTSVTLAWDPPVTNEDGSPINDLAGYKIYYGTSSENYSQSVNVGNVTTYTIQNLPLGTWYFAITAYDINGNESDYSDEVF